MKHLLTLLLHLCAFLLDELNLRGKFDLCLAQIIECFLLDLNQVLDLGHEDDRPHPVSDEDIIDQEESSLVLAELPRDVSLIAPLVPR